MRESMKTAHHHRRFRLAAAACAIAVPLTGMAAVSPATAAGPEDGVSVSMITDALSGPAASEINLPTSSGATAENVAVTSGEATVSVPQVAGRSVGVSLGDTSVSIQLPDNEAIGPAVAVTPGVFAYPSTSSFANIVIPLDNGVQLLTTLTSADAPTSFAYDFDSAVGTTLGVADDGSAIVIGSNGHVLLRIAAPWAVDAAGVHVPTWFEAEGSTLVQVVDHSSNDYSYPVVADPRVDSGFGWTSILFNRHETNTIASAGIVALGGATAACGVGGPVGVAACSIASAAIGATAVYAKDNGQCVGLSFWGAGGTTVAGWNPFLHNGRDCS